MKKAFQALFCATVFLALGAAPAAGQSIDYIVAVNSQPGQTQNSLTNYGHAGDIVYIYGNGFSPSSVGNLDSITFNGVGATVGQVLADNEIEAQIPAGATTGLVGLYFDFSTVFSPSIFTIIGPGPYVTGFSPVRGNAGTLVTIEGFGFTSATNVLFNGLPITSGSVQSDSQIGVYTPAGVTTGPITIQSPSGTFVTSSNFFVPSTITGFSPVTGAPGTNVVIEGSSFTGASAVFFNGLPAASFTVNSSSNITAVVPADATAGPISLLAPGGGFVTSSNFSILPAILGFSPPGGPPGTLVVISGQNFGSNSVSVEFNGLLTVVATNNGGTNLSVFVPNSASTGPITVLNGVGSAVTTTLFYLAPVLNALSPIGGAPGATVTISGQNFTGVTNVEFGGLSAAFTVTSASAINATVPNGVLSAPVVVSNPGGSAPPASGSPLYFYGLPVFNSISTNAGAPGSVVTLTGVNLLGTTNVSFGGVPATVLTVVNNTQVTAAVPNGVLTGPVFLSGLGGSFTVPSTFYGPPLITGVSPGGGLPGDEITITGRNFTGVTSVRFGSLGANGYSLVDNGTIQAAVPAGFSAGVITVATPGGIASSPSAFAAGAVLLTTSLSPSGALTVGWPLSLTGWVLQSSSSLGAGASWTNSGAPVSQLGNQNVATVQAAKAAQFYRLKN